MTKRTTFAADKILPGQFLRRWMVAYLRMDEDFDKLIPRQFKRQTEGFGGRKMWAWDDDEISAHIGDAIERTIQAMEDAREGAQERREEVPAPTSFGVVSW